MKQSKLVELLGVLSQEERVKLLDFAQVPYFNSGRMRAQVGPLLSYCIANIGNSSDFSLQKDLVFTAIFPGQKFDDSKLEKVMVDAHKLIRDFLLSQQYFHEDNQFFQWYDFAGILRNRGLITRHKAALSRLEKIQSETICKDEHFFYRQFILENMLHEYDSIHSYTKRDLNIPNTLEALEANYLISRLLLLNRLLVLKQVINTPIGEKIAKILDEKPLPESFLSSFPIAKINYEIFYLLKASNPTPEDAERLFMLIKKFEAELDQENINRYYTYLRNVCIKISYVQHDNDVIRNTTFELYKDNLSRGFLHYEGKLSPNTYLAVSFAAIRVKQFNWALEFIESNKHQILGENEQQDLYHFNLANYYFGIKEFNKCLDLIPGTSPIIDYLMHGKRLELKALYELQSDLLSYKLDAFKMFLSRTSHKLLSETMQAQNLAFANFLTQLMASIPGDQKRSEQIEQRLLQKKQSSDWLWLLEKARELKQHR